MNSHLPLVATLCLALVACGEPAQQAEESIPSETTASVTADTTAPAEGTTQAAVDPVAHGKSLFARCMACHSVEPGKNGIGPSLHGIVGRASASAGGFTYSPAMQGANLTWDDAAISNYLENPQGFVKGNKMAFAGLKNQEDREDLIAYLKTLN